MHSDHHCGGLQISVPRSEALIWQASNKAGRQLVTYLKYTFALTSFRQAKNRGGRQNVTKGKSTVVKWSWLLCVAPATLSHSGRSTFQFLKVDLSSAQMWEKRWHARKGRHQSDISPCFFFFPFFFPVRVCQVHLWLKLYWRDHHRILYLYFFLSVSL